MSEILSFAEAVRDNSGEYGQVFWDEFQKVHDPKKNYDIVLAKWRGWRIVDKKDGVINFTKKNYKCSFAIQAIAELYKRWIDSGIEPDKEEFSAASFAAWDAASAAVWAEVSAAESATARDAASAAVWAEVSAAASAAALSAALSAENDAVRAAVSASEWPETLAAVIAAVSASVSSPEWTAAEAAKIDARYTEWKKMGKQLIEIMYSKKPHEIYLARFCHNEQFLGNKAENGEAYFPVVAQNKDDLRSDLGELENSFIDSGKAKIVKFMEVQ